MTGRDQPDRIGPVSQPAFDFGETELDDVSKSEVFLKSEYYRLQGKLCLHRDNDTGRAIELIRKSLSHADRTEARALGRRSATDLAEALATEGQVEEALQLLTQTLSHIKEKDNSGYARLAEKRLKALKKQLGKS